MYRHQSWHIRDPIVQGWLQEASGQEGGLRSMCGAVMRVQVESHDGCMQGPKEIGDIDTDDEKDEEEQYEQWKTRELRRIR